MECLWWHFGCRDSGTGCDLVLRWCEHHQCNTSLDSGISSIIFAAGSVSTPSIAVSTSSTGFYSSGSNEIGVTCNGVAVGKFTSAGFVGVSSLATSLAGGSGGTIPYQSGAGVTAMLANGTAGQILQANGTTVAPSWVAASSLTAGNASTLLTATWASPAAIGSGTPVAGTFTTLTSTGNATIGDVEATDTHTIKGATALLANSAGAAALTVTQTGAGYAFVVEDSASIDSTPFAISATGNIGIGGAPVAAYRMLNYGPVTGATTMYGTSTQGDIQSDVTATFYAYRSAPNTKPPHSH